MSRPPKIVLRLLGLRPARERALARRSHAEDERLLRAHVDQDDERFACAMETEPSGASVTFGTTETVPYTLAADDVLRSFGWLTAATGAGKSFLVCGLIDQIVGALLARENARAAVVLLDLKGETS